MSRRVVATIGAAVLVVALPVIAATGASAAQPASTLSAVAPAAPAGPACPGQSKKNTAVDAKAFATVKGDVPRPVVLAHGWDSDETSMANLGALLNRSKAVSHPVKAFLFDYGANSGHWASVPAIASCLADYIHTVSAANQAAGGGGEVIMVGHSMGGLAIRFATSGTYAKNPVGADILAGVITLDTPHLGSPFGSTLGAKVIQTVTQIHKGNGAEGWLPWPPGNDGQTCLVEHEGAIPARTGCATPPWLPAGVPLAEIGGDVTITREAFGFYLYSRDTQGDGIVTRDSSEGYLPHSGSGTVPKGTPKPTIYTDTCTITFGQTSSAGFWKDLGSGSVSIGASLLGLGDQPLTSPLLTLGSSPLADLNKQTKYSAVAVETALGVFASVAHNADCGHTNIENPDKDGVAALDVIKAINTDEAAVSPSTKFTNVTPFYSDGRVRFSEDPDEYQTGAPGDSCFHSPVARAADTYQCSYEPSSVCWTDPAGAPYMYCMGDATDTAVLRVYQPPGLEGPESYQPDPWRIVLDDGTACDYQYDFYDTSWLVEPKGWRYTYECSGGKYEVVADGTRSSVDASTWTTHVLGFGSDTVSTVHVKAAIYAGAAPKVVPAKTGSACPSKTVLQNALGSGDTITGDEIYCSGDWATAGISDAAGDAEAGLFHKSGSVWVRSDRSNDCTLPSPVPAALYVICTVS